MNSRKSRTLTVALLGALAASVALPARAQLDPILRKPGPNERQSQQNPAPKAHGNNQNRGRMTADYLWGITNGNRTFDVAPYGRVPQETIDSPLFMDGWTYPFPVDGTGRRAGQTSNQSIADQLFPGLAVDDEAAVVVPPVVAGTPLAPTGRVAIGVLWTAGGLLGGPSTLFTGNGYHRAPAVPRAAGAPSGDPTDPGKFTWYPDVPGAAGAYVRYAIRVRVPQPAPDGSNENRVGDARYIVYYQVPLGGGGFRAQRKVCFLNQQSGGVKYLVGDDGRPAYFPFVSDATYSSGGNYSDGQPLANPALRARIELDSSTEQDGTDLYVVADSVELVQRPQTVKASPVVVPPHGGRRIDTTQMPTPADPYHQPAAGATYDATDFVNNPQDPVYNLNPAVIFDPTNVSTLFFGPTSLIEPQNGGNRVAPIDARNHELYRDAASNPVPFFSHMQVLVARTEFVVDPEVGVPEADRDGTRTLELGSVYALDWLSGTPIWRFPDRTYLPAGLRNPQIGLDPTGKPVYQVPGIVSYDRNNDGTITEDEVFLGGYGANPSGGISSGVTVTPNIAVLGQAQIPVRDVNGATTGLTPANVGRYFQVDAGSPTGFSPIVMPVAFVASNNGILYAIDPNGNNDNRYLENAADTTILGQFVPGSTNLLWSFSPTSAPRQLAGPNAEPLELYNRRLKTEIPTPGPYGASSPVVSWAGEDDDLTINRRDTEPRLFIGNQNGVVYALDARALAGVNIVLGQPQPLPIRKGEQTYNANHLAHSALSPTDPYRQDLKWWFETLGAINSTPAVSAVPAPRQAGAPVLASKGVYVTTGEGRVYCLDWDGPVTSADHDANMTWDGTPGDGLVPGSAPTLPPTARSAAALNDNLRFHNDIAALPAARPDFLEGSIRPRWTFPNRYRDIDAVPNRLTDPIDSSQAYPGRKLAEPSTSAGPIYSAPVLMDFAYLDPDLPAGLSGIRQYVVVSTNDLNADAPDSPEQGRLFLLDQIGDRRDFLTNPTPTVASAKVVPPAAPTPAANAVIYAQPLDQYVSKIGPFGQAAPVWTYRSVYDTYVGANLDPDIAKRNQPTGPGVDGKPARRPVPTVFVGGVGRLYAIDIDEASGLFLRWRASGTAQPTPIPAGTLVPGDEAVADRLNPNDANNPANPIFNIGARDAAGLARKRILARTIPLFGDSSGVDGQIVVTGGPVQNRNNDTAETVANLLAGRGAGQTTPPRVSLTTLPLAPSVPPLPTDDAPSLRSVLKITATGVYAPFGYDMTPALLSDVVLPIFDLTARYGNQDSDDPISTTRGSTPESTPGVPAGVSGQPNNEAFQYPSLMLTTADGYLHEVSTNIEGEDPSLPTRVPGGGGEPTAALGWATTEDPERFNDLQTYMVSRFGPGGTGTGIAVVTNAYFPSRDPSYTARRGTQAKDPADPSSPFRFYPPQEPNVAAGTPDFGDQPRPHFKPRGVFAGPAGPFTTPDDHTGLTGFPLDLNGLYYDKRYATVAGTMPNEAGKVRLPGYSGKGELMDPVPFDPQYPETDAQRAALNTGLPPGTLPVEGANINPSGQNSTWVFVGGDDGLFYAYTPVYARRLGGLASGFVGGTIVRRSDPGQGQAKVDIFDAADFVALRNAAQSGSPLRPSRDPSQVGLPATSPILSRAAKGKRNFFEFGETIPIIVWDSTVRNSYDASTPPAQIPAIPAAFQVTIRLTPRGGQTITRTFSLERSGGAVATYPYDPSYAVPPVDTPAGHNPAQLGIGFFEFRVDASSGLPVTPGVPIDVQVQAQPALVVAGSDPRQGPQIVAIVTGGAFESQILDRRNPIFWIANPLAVQGFLLDTRASAAGALPVSLPKAVGDPPANGIGPFRNGDTAKGLVPVNGGTLADPDRSGAEYSQALSNGNAITRFDPDPYTNTGGSLSRNPRFLQRLRDGSGGDDPSYYIPIATSAGYINHGQSGSTDLSAAQRNLRIVNRSFLPSLGRVRVEVMDDLIWRWWPGTVPNADAGDDNLRKTPVGMGHDGRINPMPWETLVTEPQPWKRRAQTAATGTVLALGNISPDYTDIAAASAALQGQQAISVTTGGGDAVLGPVSLPGGPTIDLAANPNPPSIINPLSANTGPFGATVSVKVPRFQPANLVAMHSLTSTYEPPSIEDGAQVLVGDGRVQLPRGLASRDLRAWDGSGFNGAQTITPFGYTSRMRVFVDANGNGVWDSRNGEEPYRIVEVWMGVPVDMGLRSTESPVDLGALPAGFGIQNGNLGYAGTIVPAEQAGLAPPPLREPYAPFFRPFTIQNTGNVNLWNLRASQRVESPLSPTPASGQNFFLFGMRSETVDPRFGILSFGADPNASLLVPNLMPQVVTSLDRAYDAGWDAWYQTNPDPVFRAMMDYDLGGQTVYQRYYAPLAGRHTLHKARPGSPNASVLGFPDLPGAQSLVPYGYIAPEPTKPMVGVAIPHGTPAGIYQSRYATQPGAPPMLSIFEDHDTDPVNGYAAVPVRNPDGTIAPAGPLYAGINGTDNLGNFRYPGSASILPAAGETVLRARAALKDASNNTVGFEYQPHTNPAIDLKVTVAETPITGQFPAFDLTQLSFTGLLPGIDAFPLIDANQRPASAISPAAYRGPNGRVNVYFARNADAGGNALTGVGAPFRLFHTHMNWSEALGTFVAANFGTPVADPFANQGRWFTPPLEITATGNALETNTSPFVLQTAPDAPNALLLWSSSQPTSGGTPADALYFSRLDINGVPASVAPWYLNPDPTIRRFGPRAVYDPITSTTVALFYGGGPGKWRIYYSPRAADASGVPTDTPADAANRQSGEFDLQLPAALTSASEPTAIVRRLATVGNGNVSVVDVTYTGTLRSDQSPDLFLTRFVVRGAGRNARLVPITLPAVQNERLIQEGRELVWQGRHVSWLRDLGNPAFLPAIRLVRADASVVATDPTRWQIDAATESIYQAVPSAGGVLYIYVDTSNGSVRFRGAGAPTARDNVFASYQPQTYRLTRDGASDSGAHAIFDTSALAPGDGVYPGVVRRPNGAAFPVGRQWVLWQKGAVPNRPAGLFFSALRVGIDLRSQTLPAVQRLAVNESILLNPPASPGASQLPAVQSVTVAGIGPVPYEVDFVGGRIYVDALYEGLGITVQYTAARGANNTAKTAVGQLQFIEELGPTDAPSMGLQVPMQQTVNEGQVAGFLDQFNAYGSLSRTNGPNPVGDPTLVPGRLWMFWTSSRGRIGRPLAPGAVLPSGFDLLYQTLAPNFEVSSFSGLP